MPTKTRGGGNRLKKSNTRSRRMLKKQDPMARAFMKAKGSKSLRKTKKAGGGSPKTR